VPYANEGPLSLVGFSLPTTLPYAIPALPYANTEALRGGGEGGER
jgi:hypothetical protein